jgi:hypothetical protein
VSSAAATSACSTPGPRLVTEPHRELGAIDKRFHQVGGRRRLAVPGQRAVQDPGGLPGVALGVAQYDRVPHCLRELAGRFVGAVVRRIGVVKDPDPAAAGVDDREAALPVFFRLRGLVIRGMPETSTAMHRAHAAAKAS